MEIALEDLFDLAEKISDAIGIPLAIKKLHDGWYAHFVGISKRDNVFSVSTGPHDTIKEAVLAALKAVRPG